MCEPPSAASPTCHLPPVERTTVSAMARPSRTGSLTRGPVEPVEEPRSLRRGDPRAAVAHSQAHSVTGRRNQDPHRPSLAGVPAGVVHQDPCQAVNPTAGGALIQAWASPSWPTESEMAFELATSREPICATFCDRDQVDRLVTGRGRFGVESCQPQEILDDVSQPGALVPDASEGVAILRGVVPPRARWSVPTPMPDRPPLLSRSRGCAARERRPR